jgi:hypothetical protein
MMVTISSYSRERVTGRAKTFLAIMMFSLFGFNPNWFSGSTNKPFCRQCQGGINKKFLDYISEYRDAIKLMIKGNDYFLLSEDGVG